MTKEQALEIIKLLSALECWGFANGNRLPDYLHDQLSSIVDQLTVEVLK
jgi:hypothetical protein